MEEGGFLMDVDEQKRSLVMTDESMDVVVGNERKRLKIEPPLEEQMKTDDEVEESDGVDTHASNNPFLLSPVLGVLFKNIIQDSLSGGASTRTAFCTIRSVCRDWRDVFDEELRKENVYFVLGSGFRFPTKTATVGVASCKIHIAYFLRMVNNHAYFPINKYYLKSSFFDYSADELLQPFLQICGPKITDLKLDLHSPFYMCLNGSDMRALPSDATLPNLQTLVVQLKTRQMTDNFMDGLCGLLEVLLRDSSKLRKFEFDYTALDRNMIGSELHIRHMGQLEAVICNGLRCAVNLESVSLLFPLTPAIVPVLASLKLKELKFSIGSTIDEERAVICEVLKSQASSLTSIQTTRPYTRGGRADNGRFFIYPSVPGLLSLDLFGGDGVPSLPVSSIFPSLSSLILTNWDSGRDSFVRMLSSGTVAHPRVKTLALPLQACLPSDMPSNLSQLFPSLNSLSVGFGSFGDPHFRNIFTALPALKSLRITITRHHDNIDLDSILTGIPFAVCRGLAAELPLREGQIQDLLTLVVFPSLVDLSGLRSFVIDDFRRAMCPRISDLSAYLAFFLMPSLHRLQLPRGRMSDDCINALKRRFDMSVI